jgi:uncharacterized protein (TIGR02594 family)
MPIPPRPSYIADNICTEAIWASSVLSERALFVARSQQKEGVKEIGNNWGPVVKMYLAVAGIGSPAPWCAAFVTWCLLEAGANKKKLPKNPAATYFWWDWSRKTKRTASGPARGLLFVWNGKGGGHIGVIVGNTSAHFVTIEGNTNEAGSREGTAVMDKTRKTSDLVKHPRWGFIDVSELDV